MVKVLFRRPCHVPPCLINGEGGSIHQVCMAPTWKFSLIFLLIVLQIKSTPKICTAVQNSQFGTGSKICRQVGSVATLSYMEIV